MERLSIGGDASILCELFKAEGSSIHRLLLALHYAERSRLQAGEHASRISGYLGAARLYTTVWRHWIRT